MSCHLIVLLPGSVSSGFINTLSEAIKDYHYQMITRTADIPSLQNKKILWAVELNEYGVNLSLEKMMLAISQRGEESLKNSQGAIIIQSSVELWTKSTAHRIILRTNQLGCRYMGHPVVEATLDLVNFRTWQKQLNIPLSEIYRRNNRNLMDRLINNGKNILKKPRILVLYSNPSKTSNTMMLWQMVKKYISDKTGIEEKHVENGTIVDCRGCLYKTCKHYSEMKSCFYGGIVVQEILPAIEKADYLVWLCPNYNDAVSAKLMAVINRLTVLYKRIEFERKTIFAVIVSGNSGSENVAMQLIGALNLNKGFQLPPYFSIMAIANDPGAVKLIENIGEKARKFAINMRKEIGF